MDDLLTDPPDTTTGSDSTPAAASVGGNRRTGAAESVRILPDIATGRAGVSGTLDRVGMSNIEVVLNLGDADGATLRTPARADAFVDVVDEHVKGIHMSRLYLLVQAGFDGEPLSAELLDRLVRECVDSHRGTSTSSRIAVAFEHTVRRPALLSDHAGWRSYPVRIATELNDGVLRHEVTVKITYSSTCPCSAALSRQLLQEGFDARFRGRTSVPSGDVRDWLGTHEAIAALPHAQRSHATVTVVWNDGESPASFGIERLIDIAETAVATPVQAVVKRADEQEFARLNAENLMFCEDAARRIRAAVEPTTGVADFRIEVRHLESLHPHDAVAVVTKGLPGGLVP